MLVRWLLLSFVVLQVFCTSYGAHEVSDSEQATAVGRGGKGGKGGDGNVQPTPPTTGGGGESSPVDSDSRRRRRRRRTSRSSTPRRRRGNERRRTRRRRRRRSGPSRGDSVPPAPSPPEDCNKKCKRGHCLMFGDPHFRTFDGSRPTDTTLRGNTDLNHFWLVKHANVQIQGMAWDDLSWSAGVAISGPFIAGHQLIALNGWEIHDRRGNDRVTAKGDVTWDGKLIQESDGESSPMNGVRLTVQAASLYDGIMEKLHVQIQPSTKVHRFELPWNVKVYVVFTKGNADQRHLLPPGAAVLISMPQYKDISGYCGNFNGDPKDDRMDDVPRLRSSDDLFRKAGHGGPKLMQFANTKRNSTKDLCEGDLDLYTKALSGCRHVERADIQKACIKDACLSGDPEFAAEATNDILLMSALSAPKSVPGGSCECG